MLKTATPNDLHYFNYFCYHYHHIIIIIIIIVIVVADIEGGQVNRENYIMRSLVICTPYPILCGW